ncbi:MAG: zinc ribbon domain-containing protein [Haloarculaceae archaeon]
MPDGPVCPDCGTDVDEDDNFCADCGRELPDFDADALSACPACEADVDEDDNFCANCGEDLDAHRSAGGKTPAGAAQSSDDAAAAQSDGDATAVGGERSDTESAGGGTTESGEDGADADQPSTLLLKARGREISVTDGDTVGREVRSLITDTGGEEDEAVRVHREHVRFVREDGQFYVVDLGENPTRLNGRSLRQGDREPIVPGNELELSGVVTLTVARP